MITPSQILFYNKTILNERPENMSYEDYRVLRSHQSKIIKKLSRSKPSRKIAQLMPIRFGYNAH